MFGLDITLERILSLIPKKENGKFKHGALSTFARELGFKDGHIISDWMAGNSKTYMNYLYQISVLKNVSIEWLKGDTNEKRPFAQSEGLTGIDKLTPENLKLAQNYIDFLLAGQQNP